MGYLNVFTWGIIAVWAAVFIGYYYRKTSKKIQKFAETAEEIQRLPLSTCNPIYFSTQANTTEVHIEYQRLLIDNGLWQPWKQPQTLTLESHTKHSKAIMNTNHFSHHFPFRTKVGAMDGYKADFYSPKRLKLQDFIANMFIVCPTPTRVSQDPYPRSRENEVWLTFVNNVNLKLHLKNDNELTFSAIIEELSNAAMVPELSLQRSIVIDEDLILPLLPEYRGMIAKDADVDGDEVVEVVAHTQPGNRNRNRNKHYDHVRQLLKPEISFIQYLIFHIAIQEQKSHIVYVNRRHTNPLVSQLIAVARKETNLKIATLNVLESAERIPTMQRPSYPGDAEADVVLNLSRDNYTDTFAVSIRCLTANRDSDSDSESTRVFAGSTLAELIGEDLFHSC